MRHLSVALLTIFILVANPQPRASAGEKPALPRIVAHRGLFKHAPENTLAAFAACIDLRFGFELDIRRTKDGVLVCVHDDDVDRTTNGKGKVSNFTLAEMRKLDAGGWFDRRFAGEKVPTLEEVFLLLKSRGILDILVALDIKVEDETLEGDVIALAKKHGVLKQVMCIGLAISDPKMRAKLRTADAKTPVAVLANKLEDLPAALNAKDADWVYVRFMPTAAQVKTIHSQGKRVFLVGPLVAGSLPENWRQARDVGVNALLTDYPLECEQLYRAAKTR